MNDESWKVKDEGWKMTDEGWRMKVERWRKNVERWRIKVEGGFEDGQTDERTDICDCRVAFATEKLDKFS